MFRTLRLRAAHAPGALSRGDARPGTSKFAHHRNGHLTGVFAIYRFCLRDAAVLRNTCELMSPWEAIHRRAGVHEDAPHTFP